MEEAWGDAGLRQAAPVLLVGAAALVGCGDGEGSSTTVERDQPPQSPAPAVSGEQLSKEEYERSFKDVIERFEQPDSSVPKFDDQARPEQQAATFARYQGLMRNLAAELDRLRPPADADRAHADYVAGLRGIADDMQKLVDLLRAGDQEGVEAALAGTTSFASPENVERLGRARVRFQELGYDLGIDSLPGGAGP